jgi:hypothetical protein
MMPPYRQTRQRSITTFAGELVSPADASRAETYATCFPRVAKWLMPDGSVVSALPVSGGDGSGGTTPAPTPANPVYFGSTNTAAATAVKVVTGLPDGYVPSAGDFLLLNYTTSAANTAIGVQLSIGGTAYPVYFNGISTNAVTGSFRSGAVIPFYFNGTRFHQLLYPKTTDDDTTYTGFFEQTLTGVRLPINPDQDVFNYQFAMERADGTFDRPLSNTSNVTTTNKPVNIAAVFKVDGLIFANTNFNLGKGSVMAGTVYTLLQTRQASMLISYAMNGSAGLAQYSWVYLVGIPQADPMLYTLDPTSATSWYTTTKPAAEDGKVYIRLGYYETGTAFNLFAEHPAYWFKDGYFRPYLTIVDISNGE